MNVLFITNIPSPYRVDFFNELSHYCNLTVAFEGDSAKDRDKRWKNDNNIEFNRIFLNGIRTGNDSFLCLDVINVICRNWDLIILGGYSTPTLMLAIEILSLKKRPFYIEVDGGLIKDESKIKYVIKKHYLSKASGWFSTGNKTTDYLTHYGADRKRCYHYPFTSLRETDIVDSIVSSEEKKALRVKLGIKEDKVILGVGQLIYRKGWDYLIEASCDFDDHYGFYIVGGKAGSEYVDLVEKCQAKNVHFVDFMVKDALKEYYMAADLFVLPTREDIWGLVINEAMGYGLPIITTDKCVAGTELVHNNGVIINDMNSVCLSNTIKQVFDNDRIASMSKESLSIIKKYTIEEMARIHYQLFEMITNRGNE